MREVPSGWLLRYLHANGASFFFIVVYIHVFRGIYYSSYAQPREFVWLTGVIILLLMIITAFIGYVLPWGKQFCPIGLVHCFFHSLFLLAQQCKKKTLSFLRSVFFLHCCARRNNETVQIEKDKMCLFPFILPKTKAENRIGPHNKDIISIIVGSLLGDGWGEKRINSTRFHIHCSQKNVEYLMWLHKFLSTRGYCSPIKPKINKQIATKGAIYYSIKIKTWSFSSFNWIYNMFYKNQVKVVPLNISNYLTPLALAIWFMDDGSKHTSGVLFHTNSFKKEEVELLQKVLMGLYKLTSTLHKKEHKDPSRGYLIYIPKRDLPLFISIIESHIVPSMRYKLGL